MFPPPTPLNKQQLQLLKERFQAFLNGETQIVADEAFCNAVRSYYENELGVDLGHVSVIELLHSLFDLVLVGLNIHN
ncbi:hypothetical protein P7K49_025560 [Saguinus oedipus]|uniref:Uncharacterized protein n=1 Tax=Saguinus oedipus TaxID=9490 RepID=A0ABQ9UHL2_SAGOE|nr:hypothetical protein P7K49_025560 [Saguinus oedipus]